MALTKHCNWHRANRSGL